MKLNVLDFDIFYFREVLVKIIFYGFGYDKIIRLFWRGDVSREFIVP